MHVKQTVLVLLVLCSIGLTDGKSKAYKMKNKKRVTWEDKETPERPEETFIDNENVDFNSPLSIMSYFSPWQGSMNKINEFSKVSSDLEGNFIQFMGAMNNLVTKPPVRDHSTTFEAYPHKRYPGEITVSLYDDEIDMAQKYRRDTQNGTDCSGYGVHAYEPREVTICTETDRCRVSILNCQGTNYTVEEGATYGGNAISSCRAAQLICSDDYLHEVNYCSINELTCNGNSTTQIDGSDLSSCSVNKLTCGSTVYDYTAIANACNDSTCTNGCSFTELQYVCVCPLDRIGDNCELFRSHYCDFTLRAPVPVCKHVNDLLDDDPVCFEYRYEQEAEFQYTMNCSFTNLEDMAESIALQNQFDYYVRKPDNSFAVSNTQFDNDEQWQARFKIFDFTFITDTTQTQYTDLTEDQILGAELLKWKVQFNKIDDNFYAGNRLYFEVATNPETRISNGGSKVDRRFIDVVDVDISRDYSTSLSGNIITWIIVCSIIGAFAIFLFAYWAKGKIDKRIANNRYRKLQRGEIVD